MNELAATFLIVVIAAVYMLPGLAAVARKTKKSDAILTLNLLLGWTFLGWVLALVWAIADDPREEL